MAAQENRHMAWEWFGLAVIQGADALFMYHTMESLIILTSWAFSSLEMHRKAGFTWRVTLSHISDFDPYV